MLKESNHLVFQQTITHRYPYDWRAKTPVIFRVTPQWFINTAQLTRDGVILEQLKNTKMVPSSSIARLSSMIQSRPDWCISRQRAWGIPIPVVYRLCDGKKTVIQSETNIDHIISLLDKNGTDYWFGDAPDALFVCDEVSPLLRSHLQEKANNPPGVVYRRCRDTLDVWFDSGCSWFANYPSRIADL